MKSTSVPELLHFEPLVSRSVIICKDLEPSLFFSIEKNLISFGIFEESKIRRVPRPYQNATDPYSGIPKKL
jgi:hypothetical protein